MKYLQMLTLAVLAFALFTGAVYAQKKPAKKPTVKKPVPAVIQPLDVRAAREKVETQLGNVNIFVDKFGPIATALETLDTAYATTKPTQAKLAKHETNKKNVVQTIRNLRDGLATLESEFRTKSSLQKYLPKIQGITDLATQAADLALEGKFVAAKEPLRSVSKQLTDTLTTIPR